MIVFPNCKINLGLRVLDTREDGYHNIESVFYPVKWCDALEIVASENFSFEVFGNSIDAKEEDNLCVRAYRLLEKQFSLPPVEMCLLKNIPSGAGLGGGSSDAAFTLELVNDFFRLNLSTKELKSLAAKLGSDCSFFIENTPSVITGQGEQLQPIQLDLSSFHIVIIYPGIEVNTAQAYRKLDELCREQSRAQTESLSEILQKPIKEWKIFLENDFEAAIFPLHPPLEKIKELLYQRGALYASMSGSGSAVYGIFDGQPETVSDHPEWKIFSARLG